MNCVNSLAKSLNQIKNDLISCRLELHDMRTIKLLLCDIFVKTSVDKTIFEYKQNYEGDDDREIDISQSIDIIDQIKNNLISLDGCSFVDTGVKNELVHIIDTIRLHKK